MALQAQNVVIHPSYLNSRIKGTDLAFTELKTPVTITDYVAPVCLWNDDLDFLHTGNTGTVGTRIFPPSLPTSNPLDFCNIVFFTAGCWLGKR